MKKVIPLVIGLFSTVSLAGVHTTHKISTSSVETYQGRLVIISGNQGGYFVDAEGNHLGQSYEFTLSQTKPIHYGFGFDYNNTDFNVAYSLTLYAAESFTSKACVFNVTASGPGVPDIRIQSYNNATCRTQRNPGKGTDFVIS